MLKNAKIIGCDINPEEYHKAEPGRSRGLPLFKVASSSLRLFWYCPSKWVTPIVDAEGNMTWYERAETDSTRWGNIFDCYILSPHQFEDRYVTVPDTAPRKPSSAQRNAKKPSEDTLAAIEWWDDFNAKNEGKTVLTDAEAFNVKQAAKRFLEFPGMKMFLDGCDKQVCIEAEWHDEKTGLIVPTKCLIDLVPNLDSDQAIVDPLFGKCVADLKTTANAHPSAWESWAHKAGYEVQAAWNTDHVIAATGREIVSFQFLLSENYAPWQPGKRVMSNDLLEGTGDVDSGRRQYLKMMEAYCQCLKSGRWPGYDDHDEACNGWTLVRPNPYAEQARSFGPKFVFEDEETEPAPEEVADVPH